MFKNTYKIITVNDIIEWNSKNEIKLNPKYQRNRVWNDKTKSYLIDTVLRGLPMPPIFLRQTIDVIAKVTYREVIDGQQRLRSIIEFVNNEFDILKKHNKEYGGYTFDQLPDHIKEEFLEYQIFAVVINEKDDNVIYDMFARLNTNNYILNRQELRNSKYWGEYKVAAYEYSAIYREFFVTYNIFSENNLARMDDVEFISVLMNLLINGITTDTPNSIDKVYEDNDKVFEKYEDVEKKLAFVLQVISNIFENMGRIKIFSTKVSLYTLFAAIYHLMFEELTCFNIDIDEIFSYPNIHENIRIICNRLSEFLGDYEECIVYKNSNNPLYQNFIEYEKNHRTRTTSKKEREDRVEFLIRYLNGDFSDKVRV